MTENKIEGLRENIPSANSTEKGERLDIIAAAPNARELKEIKPFAIDYIRFNDDDTYDKHDATILAYLRNAIAVAKFASTVQYCSPKKFPAALSSAAFIIGSIDTVHSFMSDTRTSPAAKILANELIKAVFPTNDSLISPIFIPYRKPLFKRHIIHLAESAVEASVKALHATPPDPTPLALCKGFFIILKSAKAISINRDEPFSLRGEYLIVCCRRIVDALNVGNYTAEIGYTPPPQFKQMTFAFYEQAC